ncbi:hypothetical protein [Lelliottia nimipressuralis]|jgi:hypothetical protein|uniref:Uncharacterized protein n=1 Tax=Lelliottia nimipressuralis TaxID=69220 RepID=A0ABY3P6A1_9ENTR|nr:hypothetical protein [Lelliottia nimipressuralis]RXJ10469.1 hypothetical protein ETG88_20120 [Lelliottia nimipressuralis]TYT34962.1 hypothetical protein FZO59_04830 [Lelliottia nimipressuralis]
MSIKFFDKGATATITFTTYIWQYRKRTRFIDAALLGAPQATCSVKHGLVARTVISGPVIPMMRAYKMIRQEANK